MLTNGILKTENGILRAHVDSFSELFNFSQRLNEGVGTYYFRGQGDAKWGLTTTLERFESQLNTFTGGTREMLLKEFRRLIRGKGLLKEINISSDEDLFCLAQHYGMPTPMLDWSESFYIALFFAFADEITSSVENVAVWAIQTSASQVMNDFNAKLSSLTSEANLEKPLEMKFLDPLTDVNSRLISQSGILLQKPSRVDLEKLISMYCAGNSHSPVLIKITIPAKERENVINALFSMNINWATIYPGIEGAAKHAKMKIQMLDLKVRRMGKDATIKHSEKRIFGPL